MRKKIKVGNKLTLDKETIARLNAHQLSALVGGGTGQTMSCDAGKLEDMELASCCRDSCGSPPTQTQ